MCMSIISYPKQKGSIDVFRLEFNSILHQLIAHCLPIARVLRELNRIQTELCMKLEANF